MFDMEQYRGKKVFVSGGAGVIGSYLVDKLHKCGAELFVGDLEPFPRQWPKDILYRRGDLNYITKEELDYFAPEYFFHLAATFERTTETYGFWEENFTHNIQLSNHLMSLLKDSATLKRVVFASSYLIYDECQYLFDSPPSEPVPLKEKDRISPRNICGAAKLLHETELAFLRQFDATRFSSVCARIYRSFGRNSRDIISRWIRALINNETIEVYNKESRFDYIYAEEVAEGLLRLAMSWADGIVNLGSGRARSVGEVIAILCKHFPTLTYRDKGSSSPFEASQADMTKTASLLGWKPVKQLEQGIEEIVAFERSRGGMLPRHSPDLKNILVTSSAAKIPLINAVKAAAVKIGGEIRVFAADASPDAISQYFADCFWNMPKLSEIDPKGLIAWCRRENIGFIIPTRDGELEYFASIKNELGHEGISVMVPEIDAVRICLDKLLFFQECRKLGLPAIETSEDITTIQAQTFAVKERYGAGSLSIGLGLAADAALVHAKILTAPVYQPFIKGKEYSVDVYLDRNAEVKGVVVRERVIVKNGEAKITKSCANKYLENIAAALAVKVKLYGHSVTQIIVDRDGVPHIVECNSRFGGASILSAACGLDSFYWFLLESMGEDISSYPVIQSKKPLKMIRYETDLFL